MKLFKVHKKCIRKQLMFPTIRVIPENRHLQNSAKAYLNLTPTFLILENQNIKNVEGYDLKDWVLGMADENLKLRAIIVYQSKTVL